MTEYVMLPTHPAVIPAVTPAVIPEVLGEGTLNDILNWLTAISVLLAGALSLAAAIGVVRFRDPLSRLHAATKPQVFGLILIIVAVAISARSWMVLFSLVPAFVLQSLSAPVSAHMVSRAAYRADQVDREHLAVDELQPVIEEASTLDTQWPIRDRGATPDESDSDAGSPDEQEPPRPGAETRGTGEEAPRT